MNIQEALTYSLGLAEKSISTRETRSQHVKAWAPAAAQLIQAISKYSEPERRKLLALDVPLVEQGLHEYQERAYMAAYQAIRVVWDFERFDPVRLTRRPRVSMIAYKAKRDVLDRFPCADRMLEGLAEAELS